VSQPKYPEVKVQLSGTDGNVFAIIGKVSLALKRAGLREAAKEINAAALRCKSYDEVLVLCMTTVSVT